MENKDFFHQTKMKALQKYLPEESIPRSSDLAELRRIVKHKEYNNDEEQHYIEIVESNQPGNSKNLIEAQINEENGVPIVTTDNANNFDFMNFRVIRCREDGTQVSNEEEIDVSNVLLQVENGKDAQFILQNSNTLTGSFTTQNENNSDNYIQVIERDSVPLVFFSKNSQSDVQKNANNKVDNTQYVQIVDRDSTSLVCYAKNSSTETKHKNTDNKSELSDKIDCTIPKEVIESPNFKLYLYHCKFCNFKCNAIKELTAHKKEQHNTRGRFRSLAKPPVSNVKKIIRSSSPLYTTVTFCPLCDFSTLTKHLLQRHLDEFHDIKSLQSNSKGK